MSAPHTHTEDHFEASDTVRDIVIGMADGLTVPFALAAGISGALTSTHIVVTAGIAEIAAGAMTMPEIAASEPFQPRNLWPTATDRLTILAPGRNWHRARASR